MITASEARELSNDKVLEMYGPKLQELEHEIRQATDMGKSYIYLMGETLVDEIVSFLTSQGYKVSSSGQLRGDGYYQKDTIISW